MLTQEIIRRKREGEALSAAEIASFIEGLTQESVTEGQAAAFAMAVFLQGMNPAECAALTMAMRDSGEILSWTGFDGPVLDKHSTGGVGDNVSLILAPALAACGAYVPMISGRGLGHAGGTLDKLDSIPGYQSQPGNDLLRHVVGEVGCAIIGQTDALAPADRRLYGIRDVTATVESIPLITASILSKKLAAGLDGLLLDVKTGSGAYMPSDERSRALAESLVQVANGAGLRTAALITDMNEPLASAAGNAVEVRNAIDFLTGQRRDARLATVTLALGAELLFLAGLAGDMHQATQRIEASLSSGRAAEIFGRMVAALGGPSDLVERPEAHLPAAPVIRAIRSSRAGIVQAIDTRAVGIGVVELGGGRIRPADPIDHAVGFTELAGIGERVDGERPLAIVCARNEEAAEQAAEALRAAYVIGDEVKRGAEVVRERIG